MARYEIRSLASLPWPHGLGKSDYPELRLAMRDLLTLQREDVAAVHERAFATDAHYRETAEYWLSQTDWSASLIEAVSGATPLACAVGLLGRPVDDSEWIARCQEYCDAHGVAYGARWTGGPYVAADYLQQPITACNAIDDGRHRLTYLRLRELAGTGPSAILVKVIV